MAVVIDGQPIESRLPGRQGRLLVAYLAAHRAQPVERTVLLDALWPNGRAGAAGTLTVLLSKVRPVLVPAEIRGRRTLQLLLPANSVVDLETATTSLHSAESAVALRDWRRAWPAALAAQYASRRRFLTEFEAPWIDEWRPQLELIYERALACYGEACLGIGGTELPAAERAGRRLVAQAPLAETGHRLLMRALAARGDAAAALAAYDQLRQLLREELGVSPCPATQALHARLLHGQPLEEPARPVPPARSARSGSQARSSSGAQAGCRGRRAPGGTGRWNRRSSRSGAAHCRQWAARSSRPPCRSPATTGRSRSPSRHPSPRRPGRTRPRTPAAPAAPRSHPPGCGRTWDPASVTLVFSSDPELCRSLSAYETSSRVVAAGTSGGHPAGDRPRSGDDCRARALSRRWPAGCRNVEIHRCQDLHGICTRSPPLLHSPELRCYQGPRLAGH